MDSREEVVLSAILSRRSIRRYKAQEVERGRIIRLIDKCEEERVTYMIVEAGDGDATTLLNALLYDYRADGRFRYMICMDKPDHDVPAEFEVQPVGAYTWAVFPLEQTSLEGPESVQDIWKRIYPEWFPTSGYEHADGPAQERLYRRKGGRYVVEAWVPVVKVERR